MRKHRVESIFESGSEELLGKQIKLLNERHLDYQVIDCIRNNFAELVVVPGRDADDRRTENERKEEGSHGRAT